MWGQLVAAKATVPEEWVTALPVERLEPMLVGGALRDASRRIATIRDAHLHWATHLRSIVREQEEGAAARNAARAERWAAGRGAPPPAADGLQGTGRSPSFF